MNAGLKAKNEKAVPRNTASIKVSDRRQYLFILLVIGPPFLVYVVMWLFPNILSVYYSFLQWDGISDKIFVGLDNYKMLIQDEYFFNALFHSAILVAIVPALVILISVILADILINRNYRINKFCKVLYYFPNVLSSVIIALLWVFIYDGSMGLLNAMLKLIGISMTDFYWLGEKSTALWAMIPPYVWSSVGFYVIIIMNAMAAIPKSYYEYSILEGANSLQRLFTITLPMISDIIKVSALFLVLGMFRSYETIMILTGGGPDRATDVVGLYMFRFAFSTGDMSSMSTKQYGYASTIGMFMFVVLLLANLIINKVFKREQVEF